MPWDPALYRRFADDRLRPFADLLARVQPGRPPPRVVDLGCGPGATTALLARNWPEAEVLGIDASPEMVAAAAGHAGPRVRFALGDARTWTPPAPADVVVCNAVLHWLPDHLTLLPRLVGTLAPGGTLALQVPANFDAPTHRLLHDLRATQRWRALVGPDVAPHLAGAAHSHPATDYLAVLTGAGCTVDAWETTYLHVLSGPDPVLDWMRGAGARPVLEALPVTARAAFERDYAALLRQAYPPHHGRTVLPYRRIFAVARRCADQAADATATRGAERG